jgi:uncharacterized OB-fold protein
VTVAATPVLPLPNRHTAFFWEGTRAHRLMILRCDRCGFYLHWPRSICKRCQSFELTAIEVSGRGTVYTFTIAEQAFHPWFEDKLPYVLAVVELPEQTNLKLVSNIVDCPVEAVHCGMDVEVVFRKLTDELTLPVFRPVGL